MLYFPLSPRNNHIRLLVLHPGNPDDQIRCGLIHHDLKHSQWPRFEALSYTWGNPDDTSSIVLKDQDFKVTKNLEKALRNLRRRPPLGGTVIKSDRYLWVDAICINQQDERERSEQVLRMRDIYHAADTTIIWLGEGTAESDKAMDFMRENLERAYNSDPDLLQARHYRDDYLALVEGLLIRPWWSRMWVVQEVIVSSHLKVMCGSKSVEWTALVPFIIIVHEYHKPAVAQVLRNHSAEDVPNSNLGLVLDSNRRDWQRSGPQALFRLMIEFRTWKSTLSVDKIYGLLGMAAEAKDPALKPDYKHPPEKVFRAVTRFIIEQHQRLDFICIAAAIRLLDQLPSWTPDFTTPGLNVPNPLKGNSRLLERYLYSAAKDVPMAVSFTEDSKIMTVDGIRADVIERLAPYWDPDRATQDFMEPLFKSALPSWYNLMQSVMPTILARYGLDFALDRAVAKILTADRLVDVKWTVSRFEPMKSWLDLPAEPPEEYKDMGPPTEQLTLWEHAKKTMVEGALTQRRFMVTKGGYIGLVPKATEKNDVICVLFGCDTPLVLRPVGEHYVLIGECYIHGLMDGELVDCHQEGKKSTERFEIR